MVPRRAIFVSALVAVAFGSLAAAADQGPLTGTVEALLVVTHETAALCSSPPTKRDLRTFSNTG